MKRIKKLISAVVASTFLLTVAAPMASAADVNASISRLNALGVVTGYTNGEFRPEQNITRAEFATVAVRLLGLDAASNAAKGNTKFPDVKGSHWASGYINLAVGNGIVKGYPNGSFKPEAKVSNAEAFTMLVRVLGYDPVVKGTWPQNYIGKASQLGLLDGISLGDYNAAATRGNVFLGADNALDEKVLVEDGYDNQGKVTYKVDESLMVKRLKVKKYDEAIVYDVPAMGNLQEDEVAITWTDANNKVQTKTLKAAGIDANAVLGQKVVAWEKDDKVFFFDVKTAASDIIDDTVVSDDVTLASGGTAKIKLDKKDKEYTITNDTKVVRNYELQETYPITLKKDDNVRLVMDGGVVKYAIFTSYKTGLVEKVNTSDEKITVKKPSATISLEDKNVTILKGGKTIGLADIKENDVIDYIVNDDMAVIYVSDAAVEGTLNSASSSGDKVTIGDKAYKTTYDEHLKGAYVSTDNGKNYDSAAYTTAAKYDTLFGEKVRGLLNKDGKVAFIISGTTTDASFAPMLVKKVKFFAESEKKVVYGVRGDGTQVQYDVTKDTKINGTKVDTYAKTSAANITNGSVTVNVGDVVKVKLAATGAVIDGIQTYATNEVVNPTGTAAKFFVNKSTDTITVDLDDNGNANETSYKVDANTKIVKVKGYQDVNGAIVTENYFGGNAAFIDDTETVTWAALKNQDNGSGNAISGHVGVVQDSGVAKFVVIYDKDLSASSSYKFGVVLGSGRNVDGATITISDMDGAKTNDSAYAPAKGEVVRYKLTSDGKKVDTADKYTNTQYLYVFEVDSANKRIKVASVADETTVPANEDNAFYVDINDSTKYVDTNDVRDGKTDASVKNISLTDIAKGEWIQVYDVVDADGDYAPMGSETNAAFNSTEKIYDFVVRVNK